jgi:superfamily II DNA or RNA helicase
MPTGAGKTRAAMHIIADHLRNQEPSLVIWLAHSEELCDQAAEEFQDAWTQLGNRPINLFRFWGTHDLNLSDVRDGFVVAGLAKVHSSAVNAGNFLPTLADRCSLVIIDEAHQAIAKTYAFVLDFLVEKQETTGLLGLSATPGRTWADIDEDQKLADFFLRQKVTLSVDGYDNPVDYLIDEGYLARPKFESLYYDGGNELSYRDLTMLEQALDISPSLLKIISEDEQRNLQILHRIEQLASSHKRILVFAASVMHSRLLATVLRARGITADSVTGDTHSLDRERIITKFRGTDPGTLVLCNYGVLTAGFDAPKTSAAVIARPTKSLVLYSQMLGRALRGPLAGGNKEAEIVTVIDRNLPGFAAPSETFFNWEDVWT